jgi:hypothetical protein
MLARSMKNRLFARKAVALFALLSVLALAGGCGGDDGGDGGLSGDDKLQVLQARADIAEYCSVQAGGTSSLTDRSLGIMLDGVRTLARVHREKPDAKIEIQVVRKSLTMEQLMQQQIRALRRCGRDGRQQAGVLEAALQQQQS